MKITPYRPDIKQEYKNPFKENNIYPFNRIGRVACDKDTAEIRFRLHDNDSNFDERNYPIDWTNLDIYTYIPKFYSKRTWKGEVLKDEISTEVPTEVPTDKGHDDWEIHPAFLRADGTVRPYILIGCFEGTEVGGQLRSIPSGAKPMVSATIATFMSKARQGRNNNFSVQNPQAISVFQFLCKVAFGTLNLQSYVGNGWTSKSESAPVGTTMVLGNKTGYVGVNGNQVSIFGVEDPYGNIWDFVTGIYAKDEGYRITHDTSKFGGASSEYDLVSVPILMGATDGTLVEGYIKKIHKIEGTHKYWCIASELGGTESTYYTDYFWSHRKGQENICNFGSSWVNGVLSGAFCLGFDGVASGSWTAVGARLCYLP